MKTLLKDYDQVAVNAFINYLSVLENEKNKDKTVKNKWYPFIKPQQFADIFIKVYSKTGMYIDGENITIANRGKLIVNFDYHAYKNAVSIKYPETKFDFGVVYVGDIFSFRKESGKVIYSHVIGNPFDTGKIINGAYGIIKNSQGEFLEILNTEDIEKMKKTSTMKNIWEAWEDRMVLKSAIRRICNVNFHDITKDIISIDNESESPENVTIDDLIQKDIEAAKTEEDLNVIFRKEEKVVSDRTAFIKLLANRKKKINDNNSQNAAEE